MPADLIVYALVAAGLVFWLRNILGTRDDGEPGAPQPAPLDRRPERQSDPLLHSEDLQLAPEDHIRQLALQPGPVFAIANKTAENGLLDIARADRNFDVHFFLSGAQEAFVMIVEGFAKGDRELLKDLLAPPVYQAFEQVISERETRGEKRVTDIHSLLRVEVIDARIQDRMALVTIRFTADETSVARDQNGNIIEGDPDKITKMVDVWTFGREIKSRNPAWLVYETRGGFEDDNDHIPDTHSV